MKPFIRLLAAAVAVAALIVPAAASANIYNVAIATRSSMWTNVFDVSGGSTAPGAKVIQYIPTGGGNQRWNFFNDDGSAYYSVVNVKTGFCLTSPGVIGAQLYVTYCTPATPRKRWMLPSQLTSYNSAGGALGYMVKGFPQDTPGAPYTNPPQFSDAEVQNNSWQPGA